MKYMRLLILGLLIVSATVVLKVTAAEENPSGKEIVGKLQTDNPRTVQDGEDWWFQLTGAPLNAQLRLWIDTGENKGYRDFGIIGTAKQSNTAYAQIGDFQQKMTLNCSDYEYLEPGKTLSVGNRDLIQKFYVEYVGLNKVSNVSWSIIDCSEKSDPVSTGDVIFPYTLESIYGRNNITKPFPDSYPSGIAISPFTFAGRYFDGQDRGGTNTGLKFEWYKPAGANIIGGNSVKILGNRVYSVLGSTIAAYNKDSFIGRLANNSRSSLAVFAGTRENPREDRYLGYDHSFLPWDAFIYPEHQDNAWLREACDCHTGITWYDIDDRGYIYFNDRFGFGIARDNGSNLQIITQIRDIDGLSFSDGPHTLPWLRTGRNGTVLLTNMNGYGRPNTSDYDNLNIVKAGGRYYAVFTGSTGGDGGTRVIDVTDPNNPSYVRSNPSEYIMDLIQTNDGTVAALSRVDTNPTSIEDGFTYEIKIYSAMNFVTGTIPTKTFSAGVNPNSVRLTPIYAGLTFDKSTGKIYSVHYSSTPRPSSSIPNYPLPKASIAVFSPSNGSFTETRYEIPLGGKGTTSGWGGYQYIYTVQGLSFNSGHLAAYGQAPDNYSDVKIWKFQNNTPEEMDTKNFIHDYYKGTGQILDATLQAISGKLFLFVGGYNTADVYEITGVPAITDPLDPQIPGPTTTPTTTPSIPPLDPDIFKKTCEELYAGKPALIMLCKQVNYVQERSCSIIPGMPFCKENLDSYTTQ